jgi:hypothetical protein
MRTVLLTWEGGQLWRRNDAYFVDGFTVGYSNADVLLDSLADAFVYEW